VRKLRGIKAAAWAAVIVGTLAASAAVAMGDPGVTPSSVTLNLTPGGSATIPKTVSTPAIPPKPDIMILADTTGSMQPVLNALQQNLTSGSGLIPQVLAAQPDAEFGVADYKDMVNCADPYAYRLDQAITGDVSAVTTAVNNYSASGGCDDPEQQLNALYQIATNPAADGWRAGSTRIIAWFGDAPGHDPSYGHTLAEVESALQAANIRVVAVPISDGDGDGGLNGTGQAAAITNATGGTLVNSTNPSDVANAILAGLQNLPVTVTTSLSSCDPNLTVTEAPSSQTVTSGDSTGFTEGVSVSSSATPGTTLTCTVNFLLNGMSSPGFSESITENVPKANASISTSQTPTAVAGGAISDSATVTGFNPGGQVTFTLYGPGDNSCSTPIATRTGTLNGGTASSGNVNAGGPGTYNWMASYQGDSANNGAMSGCGSEQTVVTKATPSIGTTASGSVPQGGVVSDSAKVTGGFNPSGSVSFSLYAPGDSSCSSPIATRTGNLSGSSAASGNVTVGAAGTYNWVATYTGDTNNTTVSSKCGDEPVRVTPQQLTGRAYALTANASLLVGTSLLNVGPIPDTGSISTTSSSTTSTPCVATTSGLLNATALCAKVSTTAFPGSSTASASVATLGLGVLGIPSVTINGVQSTSTTSCSGSSGTTTIAFLQVGSTVVISKPTPIAPNTTINLGVVKLVLNEQTPVSGADKGLTVNAVHLTVNALGLAAINVIAASSESDIGNCA
jgi:Integrin beta chain VWA domain